MKQLYLLMKYKNGDVMKFNLRMVHTLRNMKLVDFIANCEKHGIRAKFIMQ